MGGASDYEVRKAFVDEWFGEIRLHGDGRIGVVPREPVREIVFAAASASRSAWWALLGSKELDESVSGGQAQLHPQGWHDPA